MHVLLAHVAATKPKTVAKTNQRAPWSNVGSRKKWGASVAHVVCLPAGDYEVLVEEELLQGLSFEAYRKTATYLTVRGRGDHAGRTELRAISDSDVKEALGRDAATTETNNHSEAALSPQEDRT